MLWKSEHKRTLHLIDLKCAEETLRAIANTLGDRDAQHIARAVQGAENRATLSDFTQARADWSQVMT